MTIAPRLRKNEATRSSAPTEATSSSRPDELARGLAAAIRFLHGRVRSSHELRHSLTVKGLTAREIPRIVRECERRGILDDEAGARLWAQYWADRGYGWPAIEQRLLAKGFPAAAVVKAGQRLGIRAADEAKRAQAWAAAQQRRGVSSQRVARQLMNRGFDPEMVAEYCSDDEVE